MTPPISSEDDKLLQDLYYKENNFFGRDKLYFLARKAGIDVSRRQVYEWLTKQELYQKNRKTMKSKVLASTVLTKPYKQLAIDLIDMGKREYKGYKWILTCIDLFSKKAWAVAMKDKTDTTVANAMNKIIEGIDQTIGSIRSDRGSEFISKEFRKMLSKHGIKQVLSSPALPQSNGNIERFNGTLKRLINMSLQSSGSYDWPALVSKLVNNYNKTVNATTKKVPNEVAEKDYQTITKNIGKAVYQKQDQNKPRFVAGDRVRIKIKDPNSPTKWSDEIFYIKKVIKPKTSFQSPYYLLRGESNKYYNNDLQNVTRILNKSNQPKRYEINKLIKPTVRNGEQGYIVRWKYYTEADDTFETRNTLIEDAPKLVKKYEKDHVVRWYPGRVIYKK